MIGSRILNGLTALALVFVAGALLWQITDSGSVEAWIANKRAASCPAWQDFDRTLVCE